MQSGLIENEPYNRDVILQATEKLISVARREGIEVIFVRHGDSSGELKIGTVGWEIYDTVKPMSGEKIFDKTHCSAFRGTLLKEYLDKKKIKTIVLMGMQTEYCIDTTCRVAYEYGYSVIIPEGGTTTFDNITFKANELLKYYEQKIWNKRFASIIPIEDVTTKMCSKN